MEHLIEQIISHYGGKKVGHNNWRCKCPAHNGNTPDSLKLWVVKETGHIAVKCFGGSGCPWKDLVTQIEKDTGISLRRNKKEYRPPPVNKSEQKPSLTEKYEYHNPITGEVATAVILRFDYGPCARKGCVSKGPHKHPYLQRSKEFKETLTDGFSLRFHEPTYIHPFAQNVVVICEGQKTSNSVAEIGWTAVSYPQGSGYAPKACLLYTSPSPRDS